MYVSMSDIPSDIGALAASLFKKKIMSLWVGLQSVLCWQILA